ncbi:hypothetical protein VKT23_008037 [Stygiomarasmius scandens]|uniref:Uncharacterized protein n=1 Tax=Marasmiellus scandens TaxID=2682957 RepID=A0ABR1JJ35_9AGAR
MSSEPTSATAMIVCNDTPALATPVPNAHPQDVSQPISTNAPVQQTIPKRKAKKNYYIPKYERDPSYAAIRDEYNLKNPEDMGKFVLKQLLAEKAFEEARKTVKVKKGKASSRRSQNIRPLTGKPRTLPRAQAPSPAPVPPSLQVGLVTPHRPAVISAPTAAYRARPAASLARPITGPTPMPAALRPQGASTNHVQLPPIRSVVPFPTRVQHPSSGPVPILPPIRFVPDADYLKPSADLLFGRRK